MEATDTHVNNRICGHKRNEQRAMEDIQRALILTEDSEKDYRADSA